MYAFAEVQALTDLYRNVTVNKFSPKHVIFETHFV